MEKKPEKTKFSIRVDTELVELADAYIRDGTVLNRTELIGDALRFYLGFLAEKKGGRLFTAVTVLHSDRCSAGQ